MALRAASETALALRPVAARAAAPGFAVDSSFSGQPFQCFENPRRRAAGAGRTTPGRNEECSRLRMPKGLPPWRLRRA